MKSSKPHVWGLSGILAALVISGCYGGYYAEVEYAPDGTVISEAPPQPLVEDLPPPPYEGALWVDGYWNWSGARYLWVPGRYMRPPRVGVVWYPGGYVRRGNGYVYVTGRWAGHDYRPRYRYVHPRPQHRGYHHRSRPAPGYQHRGRPAPGYQHRGRPAPGYQQRGPAHRRPAGPPPPAYRQGQKHNPAPAKRRSAPPAEDQAPDKSRKRAPPAR